MIDKESYNADRDADSARLHTDRALDLTTNDVQRIVESLVAVAYAGLAIKNATMALRNALDRTDR
jgi:hypothetical protein